MALLDDLNVVLGVIASIISIALYFIGIFTENKYNLINRMKKRIAVFQNKDVEISMDFNYESNSDFENIKKKLVKQFENVSIKRETNERMDFTSGSYSINVIREGTNNIFIEVERMGSGINSIKNKVNDLLGKLNNLTRDDNQILGKFLACDIDLSLPYKWNYINLNVPKKFNLKKYIIELEEDTFKSKVSIIIDKINIKFNAKEAISPLLDRFI